MDYKAIQELIKTMSNSELNSLEISTEEITIKLAKEKEQVIVEKRVEERKNPSIYSEIQEEQEKNIEKIVVEKEAKGRVIENIETKEEKEQYIFVNSPIVGTFYTSAGPDSKAFVEVGSTVKKGDPLCIIEAMKLMNEIESEIEGEVVEILARNEQMVEYGQVLFKVKA